MSREEKKIVSIMAFDIGSVNFCCTKSHVDIEEVKKLIPLNIPKKNRYDKNHECLPEFRDLLHKLSLMSKLVFADKVNLTEKNDKRQGKRLVITNKILIRLTNYLEDLNERKVFDDVTYFVIEEQLKTVKTAANNCELQAHLRGYLIMLFLSFCPIILFSSKHKTNILGSPKMVFNEKTQTMIKMTHPLRKKWASEKVFRILSDREDMVNLQLIFAKQGRKKTKSDDYSDCILETEAFLYLLFIEGDTQILDC